MKFTSFRLYHLICLICLKSFVGSRFLHGETNSQIEQKINPIFLELNSPTWGCGMFNVLSMVTGILQVYDDGDYAGLKVDFKDVGFYYDEAYGPNWWEYYFKPIRLGSKKGADVHIMSVAEMCDLSGLTEYGSSREKIYRLIKKYIRLQPTLQSKLNAFRKKNFKAAKIIGIHYRGTDKSSEAPRVTFEKVVEEIRLVINSYSQETKYRLFVATDEQAFLNFMIDTFPGKVVYLKDGIRSTDGTPVHHSTQNYKKGEDAVLDCILLSKCDILIRTSSSLSLFSTYFNPTLPVINLNARY